MTPDSSDYPYQACFCEENIWHLASESLRRHPGRHYEVLFLTNAPKAVLLMNQAAFEEQGVGCWDYHVLMWDPTDQSIFDFDSRLGFKTRLEIYFARTFPDQNSIKPEYRATIRSVAAEDYTKSFWSDRSHMRDEQGVPLSPFPSWPPILQDIDSLRLQDLYDLNFKDSRISDRSVAQFIEYAI